MGCSDSSAQPSSHGGVSRAGNRAAEAASASVKDEKRSPAAWLLLALVRLYVVFLSPILGGGCKFHPSCSNYAYEAVERHGARKGAALAFKRLMRCRPFTKGGLDPVPEILYEEDLLEDPRSADVSEGQMSTQPAEHRPTQPVVRETWSAAGALGVERRL